MSSTNASTASPAGEEQVALTNEQKKILVALANAASTLHGVGAEVQEVAESLYGKEKANEAAEARREEERERGVVNGGYGETGGFQALARAYVWLNEEGEEEAAGRIDAIAKTRLTRESWEEAVQQSHRFG